MMMTYTVADRGHGHTASWDPYAAVIIRSGGSFNEFTWYKNKVLHIRIAAYSDQARRNQTFVSTSWNEHDGFVTIVTKTTNKEKAPDAIPRVNIQDFCEEHYEDILPIIMEKARRDKRKEVQTRLNFGENSKRTRRERENSLNSRIKNSPARFHPERSKTRGRERRDDRNMFSRLSHRRKSVHEQLSDTYSGLGRTDSREPSHSRGDPEDHLKIFEAAAQVEHWAMPTCCHMFNSTLIGAARVWFDELPPDSIDGYKGLKAAFLAYFVQQKKYVKDPVEIHNIKRRDGETIEDFMERFKVETGRMKGAPECMRISGFMHGVNNP
ncbi:reverse transcriptase domain-containing protein [Tanacetum coccineum]